MCPSGLGFKFPLVCAHSIKKLRWSICLTHRAIQWRSREQRKKRRRGWDGLEGRSNSPPPPPPPYPPPLNPTLGEKWEEGKPVSKVKLREGRSYSFSCSVCTAYLGIKNGVSGFFLTLERSVWSFLGSSALNVNLATLAFSLLAGMRPRPGTSDKTMFPSFV